MSEDAESQLIANIKEAGLFFSIQLDDSADITGKTQLLAFRRFVCNGGYHRKFFILQTTPRNNKRPIHSWCCRQLFQFSRFVMEIMHQHLHGWCSLYVGKPERIRRTGQASKRTLKMCLHTVSCT
jgi:hypothetical protein